MPSIDFNQLITDLQKSKVGTAKTLSLWGGEFDDGDLGDFLTAWKLDRRDMPWRLWEWASDLLLEHSAAQSQENPAWQRRREWLERGRLFGPGGDLELRRHGACFRWRWIGPYQEKLPEGLAWENEGNAVGRFTVADYWRQHPGRELLERPRQMLLWGQERQDDEQKPQGTWHEERVGGVHAPLVYPTLSGRGKNGRVRLCYSEFLYEDNVEAVWWLGLEPNEGV